MAFAAINSSNNSSTLPVLQHQQQAPPAVDYAVIDNAFAADSSLRKRVYDAISVSPQHGALFQDIAQYTTGLQSQLQQQHHQLNQYQTTQSVVTEQPAIKKRKLEADATATTTVKDLKADCALQFYVQDVSFAVPQRKKLTLEMTAAGGYLRARNQTSKEIEFGVAIRDIQHILCLPVPEKAQRQFNFCVIPKYGDGVTPVPENGSIPDQMVFTIPDGPVKAAFTGSGQRVEGGDENAESLLRRWLNDGIGHVKVIRPDDREFVSATPEAHRKGEKAYHVKAHKGSKDGYLFFLSTGILFGFKKPLLFFSFENIESVSYTSVLQRTFNLNITTRTDANEDTQEIEFSMIDQADFPGIDAYIKGHQLQDASLAEARRAKKYNVNKPVNGDGEAAPTAEGGAGEEESELAKAQRELEDQEDEEEEDYDPGSDGDSDGSGSSSEEDDDDDEGEGQDGEDDDSEDQDEDLVKQELGSEAEDDL